MFLRLLSIYANDDLLRKEMKNGAVLWCDVRSEEG